MTVPNQHSTSLRIGRAAGAAALVLLVSVVCCEGRDTLPSPTLRVDLRDRLPADVLKRLMAIDMTYECSRTVELAAQGVSQRFELTWRVFAHDSDRYITAVQVEPDGPTQGGRSPEASATAEPTRINEQEGNKLAMVPIRLTWSATSGCATVGDTRTVALRADSPGCKPPQNTLKIFDREGKKEEAEAAP